MKDRDKALGDMISMRDSFNIVLFLARSHAMAFIPFLRKGMGNEAIGMYGLVAFLMLLFMAAGDRAGCWYLVVWLGAVVCQRASMMRAWVCGVKIHSQYWGDPWFGLLFVKKERVALLFDVVLCFGAGTLLMPFSEALGMFVMSGVVSLGMVLVFDEYYMRQRLQRMADAEIENKCMSELYRGRSW